MTLQAYTWWDQVPENLTTKTRLDADGLKPGVVRAQIEYGRGRKHRIYDLYDRTEATPKKTATPAQLTALAKGRETAKQNRIDAEQAEYAAEQAEFDDDQDAAITWARELLTRDDWVILDTETTGLGSDAEIIQLGILAPDGTVLVDTLFRPVGPIPTEATAIHHITDAMVQDAPLFADVYPTLSGILSGKRIIAYNKDFDLGMWRQTRRRYGCKGIGTTRWLCAMIVYAAFCGDYSEYHGSYRWQPLMGGDHTAIGDCKATLQLIQQMAAARLSSELAITSDEVTR